MRYINVIIWILLPILTYAQLPNTQVYSFDIKPLTDNFFEFSKPKYLSAFNATGYNNQPQFINDRELYITVRMPGSSQTDIYGLNLQHKKKYKVTDTPDGEYSAAPTPLGNSFSCVREENDGNSTQRLWQFPMDRSNSGKRVFEKITGVGYYQWLSRYEVAMFIVGEPHYLVIGDTRTEDVKKAASNIGRGMQQLPDGNLAYIQKESAKTWFLKTLDPSSLRSSIIIEMPDGSEDFIVMSDGTILTGSGSKLYKYNPKLDKLWIEIGDLSHYGIKNITRMAFNGGRKLVLVDKKS